MSPALDLGDLDRFTVGTEGPVGRAGLPPAVPQRRSPSSRLKVEKQQVSVLAEYLGRLLADLDRPEDLPADLELEEPTEPHWVVGTLGVSYDEALDRIVLVAEELVAEDEEGDMARFTITRCPGRRLRHPGHHAGRSRASALPAVRWPARPFRTRVPEDQRPPAARHLRLLAEGDIEIVGRMPWSSNHTFLVTCASGDEETSAVYKPGRGERHLWDFPEAIYRREVAAYELSQALGWDLVPETVERDDAPFGPGIAAAVRPRRLLPAPLHPGRGRGAPRPAADHLRLRRRGQQRRPQERALHPRRRRQDLGHRQRPVLPRRAQAAHGHLGVRRARPSRPTLDDDLARVAESPPEGLAPLLSAREVRAVSRRAAALLSAGRFPVPDPDTHHYPWPLV